VAWQEFLCGKRKRKDVILFSVNLLDNIFSLHKELKNRTYHHSPYYAFKINDPKPRDIYKATVRDRLLHHAIYRILYPYFDQKFISDSHSCRNNKGTHRAIKRLRKYGRIVSKNHTRTIYVLKGDIKKFFANIDHKILIGILEKRISDKNAIRLLNEIIKSFHTEDIQGKGLPLGNLTSQLFVNIYMNEFDQFVKRSFRVKHYIRYADDFVILHESKKYLEELSPKISGFLEKKLCLSLNPSKVFIRTFASGIDFLGWVNFYCHRLLRVSTKRRILKKIESGASSETVISYLGLLKHGDTYKLYFDLLNKKFFDKLN
jgi:retron-type reverse transcriptase